MTGLRIISSTQPPLGNPLSPITGSVWRSAGREAVGQRALGGRTEQGRKRVGSPDDGPPHLVVQARSPIDRVLGRWRRRRHRVQHLAASPTDPLVASTTDYRIRLAIRGPRSGGAAGAGRTPFAMMDRHTLWYRRDPQSTEFLAGGGDDAIECSIRRTLLSPRQPITGSVWRSAGREAVGQRALGGRTAACGRSR
jgi:hypothetical protein